MITPEGIIKKKVRANLRAMGAYVFSPVQMGMGAATLDDLICFAGKFVAIEYKAPGKIPTPRQQLTIHEIHKAGGIAIWGDDVDYIMELFKRAVGLS